MALPEFSPDPFYSDLTGGKIAVTFYLKESRKMLVLKSMTTHTCFLTAGRAGAGVYKFHRITEQPSLEVTLKAHQVQTVMRKGSIDEIT